MGDSDNVSTYFVKSDSSDSFNSQNNSQITEMRKQTEVIGQLLKIMSGSHMSPKTKKLLEDAGISTGEKLNVFEKIKKGIDDVKKKVGDVQKWLNENKKKIVIGTGVVGLGVLAYFLIPLLL